MIRIRVDVANIHILLQRFDEIIIECCRLTMMGYEALLSSDDIANFDSICLILWSIVLSLWYRQS